MATYKIGPTFPIECREAGVSMDGWGWDLWTGLLMFNEDVPQEQRDAIAAVLAKHNPEAQLDPPIPYPPFPQPVAPKMPGPK